VIVWVASYPRSGTTFARIPLHYLVGISRRTVYPIANDVRTIQPVIGQLPSEISLPEMAAAPEHFFVKTHELPGEDDWPAIYLVRDGRDALLSDAHNGPQDTAKRSARRTLELFLGIFTGSARERQPLRRLGAARARMDKAQGANPHRPFRSPHRQSR